MRKLREFFDNGTRLITANLAGIGLDAHFLLPVKHPEALSNAEHFHEIVVLSIFAYGFSIFRVIYTRHLPDESSDKALIWAIGAFGFGLLLMISAFAYASLPPGVAGWGILAFQNFLILSNTITARRQQRDFKQQEKHYKQWSELSREFMQASAQLSNKFAEAKDELERILQDQELPRVPAIVISLLPIMSKLQSLAERLQTCALKDAEGRLYAQYARGMAQLCEQIRRLENSNGDNGNIQSKCRQAMDIITSYCDFNDQYINSIEELLKNSESGKG